MTPVPKFSERLLYKHAIAQCNITWHTARCRAGFDATTKLCSSTVRYQPYSLLNQILVASQAWMSKAARAICSTQLNFRLAAPFGRSAIVVVDDVVGSLAVCLRCDAMCVLRTDVCRCLLQF